MRLNAQAVVRAHLAAELPEAEVGVKVPNPRPPAFVLVRREGGSMKDAYRDGPGIGVTCWERTEAKAYALADRASRALFSLEREPGVASVAEEALRSDPDPEDGSPRWYGSYTLTTYEINS